MAWLYANQIDNERSKWLWCWYLIRKANDPDCNVVKLMMLLIESNPNAKENSVQIRKTNDPDWNVVKSRMSLFRGVVKVRENSVPGILCGCICSLIALTFSLFYHSFQSSLQTILGLSDACGRIPTEVRMVVSSIWNLLYIYRKSLLHCV